MLFFFAVSATFVPHAVTMASGRSLTRDQCAATQPVIHVAVLFQPLWYAGSCLLLCPIPSLARYPVPAPLYAREATPI